MKKNLMRLKLWDVNDCGVLEDKDYNHLFDFNELLLSTGEIMNDEIKKVDLAEF